MLFNKFFSKKKQDQDEDENNQNSKKDKPKTSENDIRAKQAQAKELMSKHYIDKKSIHFPFDFDRWYENLKPFTFNSEVISISPDTARAMVNFYQYHYNHREDALKPEDIQILMNLEKEIEQSLSSLNKTGKGVFVRMSNRSPKDGSPLLENGETEASVYSQALVGVKDDPNQQMAVLCDVGMKILQCQRSDQVLNLLLTSERVFVDMYLALDCHDASKDDEWSTSIILREWEPQLQQDHEFRVFVYEDKVTAISQYNHWCAYDSLNQLPSSDREMIIDKLSTFSRKMHPFINQRNYILDLAIVGDDVKVIELNPFDDTTGACMFSWAQDKRILYGNDGSVAFKIRTEPLKNIDEIVQRMVNEAKVRSKEDIESCSHLLQRLSVKGGASTRPK